MTEPAVTVAPVVLNTSSTAPSLSAAPKDRRQYTCLCGCMHLRTAALTIGAIQTAALTIAVISVIVRYAQGYTLVGSLVGVLLAVVVYTAGLLCLFLAVRRQYPRLLLPYFAVQGIAILALLIYAIAYASIGIAAALRKDQDVDLAFPIGILVVVLMATGLNTWFTIVVAKYYHFLRGQV